MGGVRVERVVPQGESEKAGLKVGDVIQKIDKTDVKNFRQVVELFRRIIPVTRSQSRCCAARRARS